MSKDSCSPHVVYNKSCFTMGALKRIAQQINEDSRYSHTPKIDYKKYTAASKANLINDIQTKLNCKKHLDFCILNKKDDFYKEIRGYFKPKNPGAKKWLSELDIKNVMQQYMKIYEDFIFYGPVPLDFDQFIEELKNINVKSLARKKSKIGVVFNLDYSYQPGSHWVSFFMDLKNGTMCYFDSEGVKPPKEIIKLMKKLLKQCKAVKIPMKIIWNQNDKQRDDYSCGIYSIAFIVHRLKGMSCTEFFGSNLINDKLMHKLKEKYFRK